MYFCWHELLNVSQKCLVLSIFNTTTPGHPHLALLLPQSFVPSLFIIHTLAPFICSAQWHSHHFLVEISSVASAAPRWRSVLPTWRSTLDGLAHITRLISYLSRSYSFKSLLTLLKWLLKWSSQDFNICYSTSPLLSLYLAHPDSAIKSQLNHHRSVSPLHTS